MQVVLSDEKTWSVPYFPCPYFPKAKRAKAETKRANTAEQRAQVAFSDGEQQGKQNKALEIARNLLAKGVDPALVADTTGLSIEELTTLSKK
jgi:predicted transposase/invertase (TIGR01784 family)